jgi:hypothetical protein
MNRCSDLVTSLLILAISSAAAFAEVQPNPSADPAAIVVEGDTVTYAGLLSGDNVARLFDMVDGQRVSTLVITSSGGEINAGMTLGEWIFDNQLDVVVEHMCMSSCANYVFTAGRHKTISQNALVAWHGNALQQDLGLDDSVRAALTSALAELPEVERALLDTEAMIAQAIAQTRDYQARSQVRQAQFFARIGVDEYLCRIGNEEYGASDFFALPVSDMARFGVRDVHAPETYADTDLAPFRRTGKSVEFIKLDAPVELPPPTT